MPNEKVNLEVVRQDFAAAFEMAPELMGKDSSTEFTMICRFLMKGESITPSTLSEEIAGCDMNFADKQRMIAGLEKVGLPDMEESIEMTLLSPSEVAEIIDNDRAPGIFNNEFSLFTVAPGKGMDDEVTGFLDERVQFNPARQRLRSIFPKLTKSLEEYGETHRTMNSFYEGLRAKPGDDSYLMLFVIADQLLQRLVRPGDSEYVTACFNAHESGQKTPTYEECKSEPSVKSAREFLYT